VESLVWSDVETGEGPFDFRKTLKTVDWDAWQVHFKTSKPDRMGSMAQMLFGKKFSK
jgi:hypothetical protein